MSRKSRETIRSRIRMINYSDYTIIENEHLYGPGKRLLIFLQGCSLHCKGCINKHLWDFGCGKNATADEILSICKDNAVEGVTLHGGEPLDQANDLLEIVILLKRNGFTVILFTGYNKKELQGRQLSVWKMADLIISGRFMEEKKNLYMQFRGSTNQKIITHKGPYKGYKPTDGKTVAIFTLNEDGHFTLRGFHSEEIEELKQLIVRK